MARNRTKNPSTHSNIWYRTIKKILEDVLRALCLPRDQFLLAIFVVIIMILVDGENLPIVVLRFCAHYA